MSDLTRARDCYLRVGAYKARLTRLDHGGGVGFEVDT